MRAVIQRVSRARVVIDGQEHSGIGTGILVLLGVEKEDTADDASALARRIVELRIFEDEAGKMNRSIAEAKGEILAVSRNSPYWAIVAEDGGLRLIPQLPGYGKTALRAIREGNR